MSKSFRYHNYNPYVFGAIPPGACVLDVGCATGLLGWNLRQDKNPKLLIGIEVDEAMAAEARQVYDEVLVADLESSPLDLDSGPFDVIVCADILEHLRGPAAVLEKLKRYLSPEGFFLISVPNVAFASIRLFLLWGRFDYNPRGGILDENHLRFFTRASLRKLLFEVGLKPVWIRGYNLVSSKFFFLKFLGRIFPTLFAIQFLVKAVRVEPQLCQRPSI